MRIIQKEFECLQHSVKDNEPFYISFSIDTKTIPLVLRVLNGDITCEELKEVNSTVLELTARFIEKVRSLTVDNDLWFYPTKLMISLDKEIVFQWHYVEKSLTVRINSEVVNFFKIDSSKIEECSINIDDDESILCIWKWLVS